MNPKKARTTYPVSDLIRDRWSPRSFASKEISETDMNTILEAASWSFSSGNYQPWHYLYAHRGTAGFDRILACLNEENRRWTKKAAVLVVGLTRIGRRPGKPNFWCRHDLGAANMLLILQAVSMGLCGHPMGGFDPDAIIENLGVDPAVFEPVTCIALGYHGSIEELDESFRLQEVEARSRKGISEISSKITE